MRARVEAKLLEAVGELHLRARDKAATLAHVQRMYGVCLGLRIALMEVNAMEGRARMDTIGQGYFNALLDSNFGGMTRSQVKAFVFPAFE